MATGAIVVAWVWIRERGGSRGDFFPTSVKHKQETLWKRLSWYCLLLALLQWRHLHFSVRSLPPCAVLRFHWALLISLSQRITSRLVSNLPFPRDASVFLSCLPGVFPVMTHLGSKQPCDTSWSFTLSLVPSPSSILPRLCCFVAPSSPCWGTWAKLCILLFHHWTTERSDVTEYNCEKLKSLKALLTGELLRKGICLLEWGAAVCLCTLLTGYTGFQALALMAQKSS